MLLPQAVKVQMGYGIPAAAMIAQAALETGWGKYVLSGSNNLFNIKGEGPNGHVTVDAWEVVDGKNTSYPSDFRAYHSYEESFADYADMISSMERYAPAMAAKNDPEEYIRRIAAGGYATDPDYSSKIISTMRANNLVELVKDYIAEVLCKAFIDLGGVKTEMADDIEFLAKKGIVFGQDSPIGKIFRPNEPITRAEAASVVARALRFLGVK